MAFEFKLPDVGEGIDAGEVVEWHVAEGDEVQEDQPLVDVQTDKAIVGLPCPTTGTVVRLMAEVGDTVPVGHVLAVFDTARDDGNASEAPMAREPAAAAAPAGPSPDASSSLSAGDRPLASPATRRLARQMAVDLQALAGSGPGGRILREDVLAAGAGNGAGAAVEAAATEARGAPAAPGGDGRRAAPAREDEVLPLRGTRRVIARNMTASWQSVPHIVDFREIDATSIIAARQALRDRAQRDGDEALARAFTLLPLLAKVAATVARRHPMVNASVDMDREQITTWGAVNLSIAVSAPDGLVTPVVRDADRKSAADIGREIVELATAARERRLTTAQLGGGTLTVNNFGALGSPFSTPIIPPGQTANLGFGKLDDRPVVRDGAVVVRPILRLSCSGDHRALDGAGLTAFVNDVVAAIEDPVLLIGELV